MRPALPSSYLHNAAALGAAAGAPLPQHVGVAHAAHLPKVVLQVLQHSDKNTQQDGVTQ